MAEQDKVILYGVWASPYVKRVEFALKVKGIPYEYVEEDLRNKSPLLLKFNPVHKKVPVLVHNGKAIAESLVIIEYIDETWKTGPQLLPEDPYKRSQIRFWASYMQQVFESLVLVIESSGEAQEKAIKEVSEKVKLLEAGLKGLFPDGIPSVDEFSKNVTLLDLFILAHFGEYEAHEEVLGLKLIDSDKTPLVASCITALIEIPAVKKSRIPHEKMVAFLKSYREDALKSATA
ncbi:putative glutathione transferase [Rosa chinensis]|uniref:Glutathione S-transferase n=1 Tax=Rosa chinensis TaxID=74649 RepID=A0A2P6P2K3_ROSCH|nr:glutathione S-transferase U9 [Rosa chinensis]XP_040367064.1 glutathione S-transferase U9 [Rosa chinensis]PRQ16149.1 putative glutathione transferase [Rosa chinensis]